ncbi:LOW QUALITY PROTEIN: cytochrome P450 [Colletotrichum cereale]|nr:LOW QUALITY PROTEIN: cytochrome P450 [Colletotrichum cereale]
MSTLDSTLPAAFKLALLDNLDAPHRVLGVIAAITVTIALFALYHYPLPKPIPGIPYSQIYIGRHPSAAQRMQRHPAAFPIFRVFVVPLAKPSVGASEFREAQDILMHPKTLQHQTSALARSTSWTCGKPRRASRGAEPSPTKSILNHVAVDAALDFGFGDSYPHQALIPQLELLATKKRQPAQTISATADPVELPSAQSYDSIRDILAAGDLIQDIGKSELVKCAVNLIIQQEQKPAKKDGREPSSVIKDKLLGFIMAGHETTSTTLSWGVKLPADSQRAQTKLRDDLRVAYAEALAEKPAKSHSEINETREILRLAHTAPVMDQQCTQDTIILSHHIPAGTVVPMPNFGPSCTSPSFKINETARKVFRPERRLVTDEKIGEEAYDATSRLVIPFGPGTGGCFVRKLAYLKLK